jgi:hypothetical protein
MSSLTVGIQVEGSAVQINAPTPKATIADVLIRNSFRMEIYFGTERTGPEKLPTPI